VQVFDNSSHSFWVLNLKILKIWFCTPSKDMFVSGNIFSGFSRNSHKRYLLH
jgi:hypothetical protein